MKAETCPAKADPLSAENLKNKESEHADVFGVGVAYPGREAALGERLSFALLRGRHHYRVERLSFASVAGVGDPGKRPRSAIAATGARGSRPQFSHG